MSNSHYPGTGSNPEWPDSPTMYIPDGAAAGARMLIALNIAYEPGSSNVVEAEEFVHDGITKSSTAYAPDLAATRAVIHREISEAFAAHKLPRTK